MSSTTETGDDVDDGENYVVDDGENYVVTD